MKRATPALAQLAKNASILKYREEEEDAVRFRASNLFYLLFILLGLTACGGRTTPPTVEQKQTAAPTQNAPEPPLRLSEPADTIIGDLKHYIPKRMRDEGIPGLAISLIHDGEVVWTEGFGVANTNRVVA